MGFISRFIGKLFGGGKPKSQPPIVLPPAAPTRDFTAERRAEEADKAAKRQRLSEKRRRGRRASILSNISDEESQLAAVKRPAGRAAKVLLGS